MFIYALVFECTDLLDNQRIFKLLVQNYTLTLTLKIIKTLYLSFCTCTLTL